MRTEILAILNDRVASPNELARMLQQPLANVSSHVRALADLECIELVRTTQRREAVEHYYRAMRRPFFNEQDWKRPPASSRRAVSGRILQAIWDDTATAIEADSFDARTDRHLARHALMLDEQGWDELNASLTRLLRETERTPRAAKRGSAGRASEQSLRHWPSCIS